MYIFLPCYFKLSKMVQPNPRILCPKKAEVKSDCPSFLIPLTLTEALSIGKFIIKGLRKRCIPEILLFQRTPVATTFKFFQILACSVLENDC